MKKHDSRNKSTNTRGGAGEGGGRDAGEETELMDLISERAHAIWEQAGRPDGCAQEHWLRAEAEVLHEREQARQLRGEPSFSTSPFGRRS